MQQAKHMQRDALTAARRGDMIALQLESHMVYDQALQF